jgi:hypothetical protein
MSVKTMNTLNPVFMSQKSDSRQFGFSINYKIPTKNKLAKVEQNNLNSDTEKDNGGGIMNQK